MEKALLINKSIALIVFNTEHDEDVRVFLGICEANHNQYYFVNEENGWKVSLSEEQLERIQPVSEETKEILLFADCALPVTMRDLPADDNDELVKTGLKW
ncbi:MAG: hypothetical protein KGO82_01915 [Bacteroidota bacterium]|nr:hypothetical protein [Bacteroidota bacterium]